MKKEAVSVDGVRFSIQKDGKEIGRAYLYKLKNDLHDKPFGFLEDVFVLPESRGDGTARKLLEAVLVEAENTCYKLIATSRNDGTREAVHKWYIRLGFVDYGTEFRINF